MELWRRCRHPNRPATVNYMDWGIDFLVVSHWFLSNKQRTWSISEQENNSIIVILCGSSPCRKFYSVVYWIARGKNPDDYESDKRLPETLAGATLGPSPVCFFFPCMSSANCGSCLRQQVLDYKNCKSIHYAKPACLGWKFVLQASKPVNFKTTIPFLSTGCNHAKCSLQWGEHFFKWLHATSQFLPWLGEKQDFYASRRNDKIKFISACPER